MSAPVPKQAGALAPRKLTPEQKEERRRMWVRIKSHIQPLPSGAMSMQKAAAAIGLDVEIIKTAVYSKELKSDIIRRQRCILPDDLAAWNAKRIEDKNALLAAREAKRAARALWSFRPVEDLLAEARPLPCPEPGVYFLLKQGRVVYVGMTANFVARLGRHGREKEFDSYVWLPCRAEEALDLERAYIRILNPPLNADLSTRAMRRDLDALRGGAEDA